MKKLLRYGDCLVLLAAIIGCLLRFWFQNTGVDNKGLYMASHPAWLLLCLLSAGTVVFLWFLTRAAGDNQRYQDNFRRSTVGAATYILLAIMLGYMGITDFLDAGKLFDKTTGILCMISAVMLGVTGAERFSGNRPAFFLHLIPCVYFALRMFLLGRDLATEPEVCTFLFGFLSAVCMIPAFYYLWAFDMNIGNRQRSLFWSLTAAYFCLITTFESTQNWALHMLMAAFLLSNVCRLQFLPATVQKAPPAEEAPTEKEIPAEEVSVEEASATEDAPAEETSGEENTSDEEEAPTEEETPMEEKTSSEENAPVEEEASEEQSAPTLKAIPFPDLPEEEAQSTEDFSVMPPLFPVKPRAVLHADIDPETDMDAFLEDIKLFLENDDY